MTIQKEQAHQVANILWAWRITPALKEAGLFLWIFITVFIVSVAFVNANLLYHTVRDFFQPVQANEYIFTSDKIASLMHDKHNLQAFLEDNSDNSTLDIVKEDHSLFVPSEQKIKAQLASKEYDFTYSLVPPGNRLFIPAIGIDAPIVDITSASEEKLKKWDFDNELYEGVVKYPSTPEPGHKGNTLIFWHTSYYRWKKNPYGEVFAKIYDLKKGDQIKIARKWQLYIYEIIESKIVKPSEVDTEYLKYKDWEYITLMGCYPIWSDARRWLIIAKRINKTEKTTFALSQ